MGDDFSHTARGSADARRRLNNMPILVLDGGMGSYLEDHYGVVFDESRPEWSSSADTDTIQRVHADYLDAGADIILTATYQALVDPIEQNYVDGKDRFNPEIWVRTRNSHVKNVPSWKKIRSLVNDAANVLDQKARSSTATTASSRVPNIGPSLALSIGAYGATMKPSAEYTGIYKPAEMQNEGPLCLNFLQRIEPVYREDVHSNYGTSSSLQPEPWSRLSYVAFETLVSAPEVLAARRAMTVASAARSESPSGQSSHRLSGWWITVNYPDNSPSGLRAPCGETAEEIVRASLRPIRFGEGAGATLMHHRAVDGIAGETPLATPWGIGINCTKLYKLEKLVREYEDAVSRLFDETHGPKSDGEEWPWLVLYPDGAQNLRYNAETKTWDAIDRTVHGEAEKLSSQSWAKQMMPLLREITLRGRWRGIVVGGCCKTTPTDISELVGLLESGRE